MAVIDVCRSNKFVSPKLELFRWCNPVSYEKIIWKDIGKDIHCWQMETFYVLLALCAGNSPVTGEFPSQRPVTQSFEILFDLRLNKGLSKQLGRRWFGMPSLSLWRHSNEK